jgi:hypothetical protein
MSLARTNRSKEKFPLIYLLFLLPGIDAVQSIENLQTRISPKRNPTLVGFLSLFNPILK